ncbi:Bug family tripartite tricarboxylate transporter substrate binding protein [Noviherbaspirillum sp.]|uniref:Bug family tripartite tricarboxylate transporter substrate binding protein n=1 Tax=Noviherbaspirillum sp. TaxID=1926288 RepID=UPI002FE04059
MNTAGQWTTRLAAGMATATAAAVLAMAPATATAQAEPASAFPSRQMKIVVPYPAGGGTDMLARMIGQKFTDTWKQPVIVENKPGANGWIGNAQVAKAAPDGYNVLLTISTIVYAPYLYSNIPYDVNKDLVPVSMLTRTPNLLVVPASVPASTLEEFVELARKNPRKFSYGSYGQGSTSHVAGETLNRQAGLDLVHVPYKGAAPLVNDVLGGQITAAFVDAGSMRSHAKGGKVRVLAVSGTQRVSYLPDVPTFAERGYKGMELVGYFLMMAPANTPKDIVKKLSEGAAAVLRIPENAARIEELGMTPVGGTPEELGAAMKADGETFSRAVRQANIRLEN